MEDSIVCWTYVSPLFVERTSNLNSIRTTCDQSKKRKDKKNPLGYGRLRARIFFDGTNFWANLFVMRMEFGSYPERIWAQSRSDRRILEVVKAVYFVMQLHSKYNVVLKCSVQWSVKIVTFGDIHSILKCLSYNCLKYGS